MDTSTQKNALKHMRAYTHKERERPQTVLAQEGDPSFGRESQHIPDTVSRDVSVHLNVKNPLTQVHFIYERFFLFNSESFFF